MKDYYQNTSSKLIQKQKNYNLKNHNRIKHYKNENREKINDYKKNILNKGDGQMLTFG